MIKQKGPPREKTKQTKKQYLDVKKNIQKISSKENNHISNATLNHILYT